MAPIQQGLGGRKSSAVTSNTIKTPTFCSSKKSKAHSCFQSGKQTSHPDRHILPHSPWLFKALPRHPVRGKTHTPFQDLELLSLFPPSSPHGPCHSPKSSDATSIPHKGFSKGLARASTTALPPSSTPFCTHTRGRWRQSLLAAAAQRLFSSFA